MGTLYLTNSTVSGNSIISDIADPNSGGGINNGGTAAYLVNVTVARNSAGGGGGVITIGDTLYSRNSIFADNTSTLSNTPDFFGTLVSQGYNLIKNTGGTTVTGTTTGNLLNTDPLLDPVLRNNGGTTLTHSLRLGSPAVDKGSAATGITTDQRGFARPFDFPSIPNAVGGNGSDIGAFERQSTDVNRNNFFDYDGDGKADVSVFRPSNGGWYLQNSSSGFREVAFGISTDKIVPADYDGDGKTDIASCRHGSWYILRSSDGSFLGVAFGNATDIPAHGDFDGDGRAELELFTEFQKATGIRSIWSMQHSPAYRSARRKTNRSSAITTATVDPITPFTDRRQAAGIYCKSNLVLPGLHSVIQPINRFPPITTAMAEPTLQFTGTAAGI